MGCFFGYLFLKPSFVVCIGPRIFLVGYPALARESGNLMPSFQVDD